MGPGTHVSGGVAQQSIVVPTGSGTGDNLACYNRSLVCGGKGGIYWPLSQQWYTASSGTSHSTPATSGVAALIRQYFMNQSLNVPTPAITKALIMNTARYMTGVGANDTLPSNNQGMGEIDLNNFFNLFAIGHSFHDEVASELFTATGQQKTITGNVINAAKPFRVTLAWTDVPGPTSGNAFVNNLDLAVTVGGNTYKGNVFSGANSITGGAADIRNNVESVFLPAGMSGPFTVKVTATNIAGDGVPGNGSPLDQDYALVINNGSEGGGGGIVLTARVKTQGTKHQVNLQWSPAGGGTMNVLRDGVVVQTTPDDGKTADKVGNHTGTFTYQVCETDSGDCSNELDVVVQ